MIDISIIIPCFNHGKYLADALTSLPDNTGIKYEVIIVNDGSTDKETINILGNLKNSFCVIDKENGGVASARNLGVKKSKGRYIIPLDADNKLSRTFLKDTFHLIETNEKIGVVYSDKILFEEVNKTIQTGDFSIGKLFLGNYIDTCALVRKEMIIECEGYDEHMPVQGLEDWELWIHGYSKGWKFKYLPKPLFHYRVRPHSMLSETRGEEYEKLRNYVILKHFNLFYETYWEYYNEVNFYQKDPLKVFPKIVLKRYFNRFYKYLKYLMNKNV